MQADRSTSRALLAASILAALAVSAQCRANMIGVDGVTCLLSDAIVAANTDTPSGGCITGNGDDSIAIFGSQTLHAELFYRAQIRSSRKDNHWNGRNFSN